MHNSQVFNTIAVEPNLGRNKLVDFSVRAQQFHYKKEIAQRRRQNTKNMTIDVDSIDIVVDDNANKSTAMNNFLDDSIVGPSAMRTSKNKKAPKVTF